MRKWWAVVLIGALLTSGCMGGGQQPPAQMPEPSQKDIQKAVKSELHEDEMKDFLRTQVRSAAGTEMLEMALDTQDGQKVISDAVKRTLSSSVGQQAIIQQVSQMMDDPIFKREVQAAIKETLMEIMAKGAEDPKKEKEGKEKEKKGGGKGGEE